MKKRTKKKVVRFDNSMYVKAYNLAKTGLKRRAIAESLAVPWPVFGRQLKRDAALVAAIEDGWRQQPGKLAKTYTRYVYNSLPPRLRKTWDRVLRALEDNAVARVEKLLADRGEAERQSLFLHALVHYNFNPSRAMRAVQIGRKTLTLWSQDPEFGELLEEISEHKRNFLEGALFDAVEAGSVPAIIFANKTLNADRGYASKRQIEVSGSVDHKTKVELDNLDKLTTEQKIQLYDAMTGKQPPRMALPEAVTDTEDEGGE